MRTKPQSSQRKISWAGILITLAVIILCSGGQKAAAQQWNTNGNDISNANTGNVGIGTTSPGKALEIVRSGADVSSNQAVIRIRTTATSGVGPGFYLDG